MLDTSAMVDLLTAQSTAELIRRRLHGCTVQVPAHFDAEVLSAVGQLCRAGELTEEDASELLGALRRAPFARLLQGLIDGAWSRRHTHRVVDALYVELAEQLHVPLITTDTRLANSYPQAELPQ